MKLLVVIEKTRAGWSAFAPDLEGCIATGRTREQVERRMREAIRFHVEGMRAEGLRVTAPRSYSTYVDLTA